MKMRVVVLYCRKIYIGGFARWSAQNRRMGCRCRLRAQVHFVMKTLQERTARLRKVRVAFAATTGVDRVHRGLPGARPWGGAS